MRSIKYILVNESYSKDTILAIYNSRVSDFQHSHIINAADLTRPKLIRVLQLARKQWPSAKILGLSELAPATRNFEPGTRGVIRPSDAMNQIRRALSDLP